MPPLRDLTGQTFGRLTVIGRVPGKGRVRWLCHCQCGNTAVVQSDSLVCGKTVSCTCYHRQRVSETFTKHGLRSAKTREFKSWEAAKSRCFTPGHVAFPDYGGRGITMCEKWRHDFRVFLADMGPCPEGHSLDRIDTNGNYEPGNCRWADRITQVNNKRTNRRIVVDETEMTVAEAARRFGVDYSRLRRRLNNGVPPNIAVRLPRYRHFTPPPTEA